MNRTVSTADAWAIGFHRVSQGLQWAGAVQRATAVQPAFTFRPDPPAPTSTSSPNPPTVPVSVVEAAPAPSSDGVNWDCVALYETGSDYTAHGSSYSSAYGVMNQAVRENAPPDVAERILAGVASKDEQLAMAQSIERRFGIRAWAPSTAARCG